MAQRLQFDGEGAGVVDDDEGTEKAVRSTGPNSLHPSYLAKTRVSPIPKFRSAALAVNSVDQRHTCDYASPILRLSMSNYP